jgi:hypothetical protein
MAAAAVQTPALNGHSFDGNDASNVSTAKIKSKNQLRRVKAKKKKAVVAVTPVTAQWLPVV